MVKASDSPIAVRDFRLLVFAQIPSDLGDWAARIAMAALVLERTGSASLSGLVFAVSVLPQVASVFLSYFADRYARRTVMLASDAIRAVAFGVIALIEMPGALLLALAFLAGCAAPPFGIARSAVVKEILPMAYARGNVWVGGVQQLMQIVGLALGGVLLQWTQPRSALLITVAGFTLSFLFLMLLSAGRMSLRTRGAKKAILHAFTVIRSDKVLKRAAALPICGTAAGYAAEALVVAFAAEQLNGGWVWLLAVIVPAITFVGMMLVGRWVRHKAPVQALRLFPWLLLVGNGVAVCGAFLGLPPLLAGVMMYAGLGIVFAPFPISQSVVHNRAPKAVLASIFGALQSALFIGIVAAMGLGVLLATVLSVQYTIGAIAAAAAAYACVVIMCQAAETT